MREPRRFCDACGDELPLRADPTDDLCDDCGWDRAVMDGEAQEASVEDALHVAGQCGPDCVPCDDAAEADLRFT
ncbi:hypothetical protein ACG83_10865 [Frankia sp. R43]|uniref:hypothetical protein n=1 Tax=Frankia sp. R43 TaxID=269536 RepID=UPI0006D97C14|nr:hypothetical protein [Frankia sp. R43]KPM55766.1 hypothetical protein ACG83_10865 [Frankia sp. R43]